MVKPEKTARGRAAAGRNSERFTEERTAWAKVEFGTYVMYEKEDNVGLGHTVQVLSFHGKRRGLELVMTSLTEEELLAVKKLFEVGFERALPIVQARDKVARDAFEQGDHTYTRNYRNVPQLVIRPGKVFEYDESVHVGSERVPDVGTDQPAKSDGDSPGGSGERSDVLAEQVSPDRQAEYDDQTTDLP